MHAKYLIGIVLGCAFALPAAPGWGQDALRVRQLESDVLRLERDIEAQARRIDQLEQAVRGTSTRALPPAPAARSADSSPGWLVSTNWDRLRPGMKEIDVIALLGRPTSVRTDADGKKHALLYALELGPSAVLAGNVEFSESGVSEVNKPTLR